MKKLIPAAALLVILLLTACGRSHPHTDYSTQLSNLQATLDNYTAIFERQQQELTELQNTLANEIQDLRQQNEALTAQLNPRFWHGLTAEEVESDLMQNHGLLSELALLATGHAGIGYPDNPFMYQVWVRVVDDRLVIAYVGWATAYLSYEVDWATSAISWTLEAMDMGAQDSRIRPMRNRQPATPRHLTHLETVTLRFYYLDQNATDWFTRLIYHEETVPGADLWTEAIRLLAYHNRLPVQDLWYEGDTLYVNLYLYVASRLWSSLGMVTWAEAAIQTMFTFPGVEDVVFLVEGEPITPTYGFFCMNLRQILNGPGCYVTCGRGDTAECHCSPGWGWIHEERRFGPIDCNCCDAYETLP